MYAKGYIRQVSVMYWKNALYYSLVMVYGKMCNTLNGCVLFYECTTTCHTVIWNLEKCNV